jgi:hypothetical protein
MSEILPLKTFAWFAAIFAYDFGDPEPLSTLIQAEPIPPDYVKAIAAIVAGTREPNRKAGAKLKTPPADFIRTASSILFVDSIDGLLLHPANVEKWATKNAIEPGEQRRIFQRTKKKNLQGFADMQGVSVDTIKNMLAELEVRLNRWPEV